jgi:hypothetical protein
MGLIFIRSLKRQKKSMSSISRIKEWSVHQEPTASAVLIQVAPDNDRQSFWAKHTWCYNAAIGVGLAGSLACVIARAILENKLGNPILF